MRDCLSIAQILASGYPNDQIYSFDSEEDLLLDEALKYAAQGLMQEALLKLDQLNCDQVINVATEEISKSSERVIYLRCRCLLSLGKQVAANELIQANIPVLERSHWAKLHSRLLIASGKGAQAAPILQQCLRSDQQDWEALALLAALGGPQSEQLYALSLQIFPRQADALRNRAALRLQQNRLQEAINDLKQALSWRPTFTPALELLHQPLLFSGQVQTLAAYYYNLPDWAWTPRLSKLYWGVLRALGKADEAWQRAQQALERWPADFDLILGAATAAQAAGHPGAARRLYHQVQASAPSPAAALALNNLALLAVTDDDLPQALELIRQACRLDPTNNDLQLHRAELLLRQGEQEEAELLLKQLQTQIQNFNSAQQCRWLMAQSRLLQRQGKLEQAFAVAQQARQQWPGLADTWLQEAATLADLHRLEDAIALIQQAAGQVEQPKDLRNPLLTYLINQGRLEQAYQLLEQWLRQEPEDVDLLSQRAGLLIDLGNLQGAEEQLRSLAQRYPQRGQISLIKFLLQRNRPAEALVVCQQAIASSPQRMVPYQLGAQALVQLERLPEAIAMLETARLHDPERLDVLADLIGLQLQQDANEAALALLEAEMCRNPRLPLLRMALQVLQRSQQWNRGLILLAPLELADPANSELQQLKARLLRRQGQNDAALDIAAALVASNPTNLRLRKNYIHELLIQEKFTEAQQQAYALAAKLSESPQRLLQLVSLLKLADAPEQALAELQQHGGRWSSNPELPWLEINLLERLSRPAEAQARLDSLVGCVAQPTAQLLERASIASLRLRAYDAAARYALQWHRLQPANISPLWQLFNVLTEQNRLAEAMALLAQIRQRNPHDRRLDPAEADILIKQSRYESATRLLDRAIERYPTNQNLKDQRLVVRTSAGDFLSFDGELAELDRLRGASRYEAHSKYFFNINCHPGWSAGQVYEFHRNWYEKAIASDLPPIPAYPSSQFDPNKRLKVGYVSGDFKRHAVAYFSEPLLIHHDREQFELYAFATHNPVESNPTTKRFRSYMHHWIDAYGMDNDELYRKIRSLGIDILVDLSGHTGGSRLPVFARKPAPLQISAVFGAGQTTGMSRIDYLLCDQASTPPEHAPYLSEQRAEMPFAGLPYKPADDFIDPVPLPCLGGAPFTFACVTRPVRVNAQVCEVWGSILAACPQAQLVFEHGSFEEPEVQDRYRTLLTASGANAEQILFRNTRPYWQLFHHIDLLLDPWPAGSGTVGTDALWMERLTLTLASRPIMGRVMTAQLTALNLAERFVCWDQDSYKQRAIEIATTPEGMAELQETITGLRQRMQQSHLMDYVAYGSAVAHLYRSLWQQRCMESETSQ